MRSLRPLIPAIALASTDPILVKGTEVQINVRLQSHCCTIGAGDVVIVVGGGVDEPQRVCTDSVKA